MHVKYIAYGFLMLFFLNDLQSQDCLLSETFMEKQLTNATEIDFYEKYKNDPNVNAVQIVKINTTQLHSDVICLEINGAIITAVALKRNERNPKDYSWLGQLENGHGIYFSVLGEQVFSKFIFEDKAYTLLALSDEWHLLLEINDLAYADNHYDCVYEGVDLPEHFDDHSGEHRGGGNDDACTYRIALMYTDDAADNIPGDLTLFSQGLADEANTAYVLSEIALEAEIARIIVINHNESNTQVNHPGGFQVSEDFVRFRDDNDGVLDEIHDIRDDYESDVQILIRESAIAFTFGGSTGTAFGIAWVVDAVNAADAFGAATRNSLLIGRFTFTHEIGHLQGAFHNNSAANPNFARGHIFNGNNANGRTLMALGCNNGNGCRVQHFSNPNVLFNGFATGTNTRDNAQRLNQTANRTRNYRVTDNNLVVDNEVIGDRILSNHLANQTITTANNVNYLDGSRATMRAGESIRLTPGFRIENGATFLGYIEGGPCETPPVVPFNNEDGLTERWRHDLSSEPAMVGFLAQVMPNPFAEQTTIQLNLDASADVTLQILNGQGQLVTQLLANAQLAAGQHDFRFDAQHLSEGLYYGHLRVDDQTQLLKLVITK